MTAEVIENKDEPVPGDMLLGVKAIAVFLGISRRQTQGMCDKGMLPIFRIGPKTAIRKKVAARKTTLTRWLADQESASTEADSVGPIAQHNAN